MTQKGSDPQIMILRWDAGEDPDMGELGQILARHGVSLRKIETHASWYAFAIGDATMTQEDAERAYHAWEKG